MKERQTACIIGAADNEYVQHLAVAFVSLLVHLSPDWKARFYVAEAGLTKQNQYRLTRTVYRHGGAIEFVPMRKEDFADLFLAPGRHITQASYYRLAMPDRLSRLPYEKAVYLDCDVVVKGDISRLLQTPMGELPVGAVEDLGGAFRLADLDLPEGSPYFNAGVLLIGLEAWRKFGVGDKALRFLRENRHRLYFHDQDGLNAVLHGCWLRLHPEWNLQRNMLGRIDPARDPDGSIRCAVRRPSVIHFTGKSKPWHYDNAHPYKREYYRYLALTDWKFYKPKGGPAMILKRLARAALPDSALTAVRKTLDAARGGRMPILKQRSKFGGRKEARP